MPLIHVFIAVGQYSEQEEASGVPRVQNLRRHSLSGATPALELPIESVPP